jgi:hypothetical protein
MRSGLDDLRIAGDEGRASSLQGVRFPSAHRAVRTWRLTMHSHFFSTYRPSEFHSYGSSEPWRIGLGRNVEARTSPILMMKSAFAWSYNLATKPFRAKKGSRLSARRSRRRTSTSEESQLNSRMNQREAVHFQTAEQRLRELAELITALGGTMRGQSALMAWLENLAERTPAPSAARTRSRTAPRRKAGSHFGSHTAAS